jgi:hypothetical protein
MKINDFMTKDGWLREDGRVMRECAGRPARSRGCESLTMKV